MVAQNKTIPTDADVGAWLAALQPAQRRADAEALCALMARLTGEPPVLWGAALIGFGQYRYTHDSGRSGLMPRLGFAARKAALVLYLGDSLAAHADLLARLGPHTAGGGCLYLKRLADADAGVLDALLTAALADVAARDPLTSAGG